MYGQYVIPDDEEDDGSTDGQYNGLADDDTNDPEQTPYEQSLAASSGGPIVIPSSTASLSAPSSNTDSPLMTAYRNVLNNQNGPARAAYAQYLSSPAPNPQDYQPSTGRKIGAVLASGLAGYAGNKNATEMGQQILDQPYSKAVQQYGIQGKQLQNAASVEQSGQNTNLKTLTDISTAQSKIDADNRENLLAGSLISLHNSTMAKTASEIENAGLTYKIDQDTGYMHMLKANGTNVIVGKFNLSNGQSIANKEELAKFTASLAAANQRSLQSQRQSDAQTNLGTEQQNRLDLANKKQDDQITLLAIRAGMPKNQTTHDMLLNNMNKARAIVASNKAKYSKFWDESNAIPLQGDANSPEYKELYGALYNGAAPNGTPAPVTQPAPTPRYTGQLSGG